MAHSEFERQKPRETVDRRFRESNPPSGCCERRKRAERRLPVVEEDSVSEREWFKLMALFKSKLRARRLVQLEAMLGLAQYRSEPDQANPLG